MTIRNYDEIFNSIVEILTSHFGPIDSEPDSPWGQLIDAWTLQDVDVYQQLDNLIQSLSPNTSVGEAQNRIFAFLNLIRHDPTATTAPLILDGTEGTIVPLGSIVKSSVNNAEYATDANVTITKNNQIQTKFEVGAIVASSVVAVLIDAVSYSVVSPDDNSAGTATLLIDQINTSTDCVTATSVGTIVTIVSCDLRTVYSADASTNTTIFALGTPADSTGVVLGKIACPARSVNIITTPVGGWSSVDNLLAGQRGRDAESDADFRQRRLRSFLMAGGATPTGLQAKILNFVDGVSFSRVYENPTALVDEFGRPPHSVQVVAEGGVDFDIAAMIASNKSAGIATFGDVTVNITDTEGFEYAINFDRPAVKYAWVRVTIISKNFEETFPPDGLAIIRQAVFDFGSTSFSYGDDLILQRFFTPVYTVPGIKEVSVELAVTDLPGDTPVFSADNISIDPTVYTDWFNDPARIIVLDNS